ncbi:MAG: hypothetical protein R6U95_08445 [Bacteroidales bacterium]
MALKKINYLYMKKSILVVLFGLSLNVSAQENDVRFLSVNYFQKICLKDFGSIGVNQNQLLPILNNNARMHGMELYGAIGENVYVGLSALGSLNDKKNESGYTSWGGATGAFILEYRIHKKNFFIGTGVGLGCGRFTYSTAFNDGSNSVTTHVDAIFAKPKIKCGYIINDKLVINGELSRIITITGNEYYVGTDVLKGVFPDNFIIGFAIGYTFPFWTKEE